VIISESVRCGKPNCRCANGKAHRWYYYRYYRIRTANGWKLKKEYVRKSEVRTERRKIREAKNQERVRKLHFEQTKSLLILVEKQVRALRNRVS